MNRFVYFLPIASVPLLALAQKSSDDSMKTDNPYVAAVLIFVISLAVPVALISYFRYKKRGRIACAVIFGAVDWLITAPICISAGVGATPSLAIASVSAALVAFALIRFGRNLASFFRRHESADYDAYND